MATGKLLQNNATIPFLRFKRFLIQLREVLDDHLDEGGIALVATRSFKNSEAVPAHDRYELREVWRHPIDPSVSASVDQDILAASIVGANNTVVISIHRRLQT